MTTFEFEIKDKRHNLTDRIEYGPQGIICWKVYSEGLLDWVPVSLETLKSISPVIFRRTEEKLILLYDEKINQYYEEIEYA